MEFKIKVNRLPQYGINWINKGTWELANYLQNLNFPKLRTAFFKAWHNILPSTLLQVRYSKTPLTECLVHKATRRSKPFCMYYCTVNSIGIEVCLYRILINCQEDQIISVWTIFWIEDSKLFMIYVIAKFWAATIKIRHNWLQNYLSL